MQKKSLAIFTICSNNYVPMASVFLESVARFHPEAALHICLADELAAEAEFYPPDCRVVTAQQLGIPDFTNFCFRYDIMELNTAVKPFMFKWLFNAGYDTVLYFDPDIQVYAPLAPILDPLRQDANLVLTPHLLQPAEGDANPDDIAIMRAGVFNLGFLGARASAATDMVMNWWGRRLLHQCINAQDAGIFVDQKFMDLVPGFIDGALILRNPAVNVAYWNLGQRCVTQTNEGWQVDGQPLVFFHFSGFDPRATHRLSKHTGLFVGDAFPPAAKALAAAYAERLLAAGHGQSPVAEYAYGRFQSGAIIPHGVRCMFRDLHLSWAADPFATYEAYLHAPAPDYPTGSAALVMTNFMAYLHARRPWLARTFDITTRDGARGMVEWYIKHALGEVGDGRLIEPVAERAGRAIGVPRQTLPGKGSEAEPDIHVVGYLNLPMGVGEAGRLNLRALSTSGLAARGVAISLNSPIKPQDFNLAPLLDDHASARFQLFNVNLDQLPAVIDHLGGRLRPDAYRIVTPFWELPNLPHAWYPALDAVDEVWAPTRFIQTMIAQAWRKPVIRMPMMLDFEPPPPMPRSRFRLPDDAFLFFFAFDYLSFVQRKNPEAVIAAFRRAFAGRPQGRPVKLVLKTMNADYLPDSVRDLFESFANTPDVFVFGRTMSREDTLGLIGASDCVVSLHRSEGLGLLVAEAMVLGKPVIATDFSATTELVSPATGWPVQCRTTPVRAGEYPFHEGQLWANVDIDHAAWQMRRVVEGGTDVARRVSAARDMIRTQYGRDAVARQQRARLAQIERQAYT